MQALMADSKLWIILSYEQGSVPTGSDKRGPTVLSFPLLKCLFPNYKCICTYPHMHAIHVMNKCQTSVRKFDKLTFECKLSTFEHPLSHPHQIHMAVNAEV